MSPQKQPQEQPPETRLTYREAVWPSELQSPRDILGTESLSADYREKLVLAETPFVITNAEAFYWPDGAPAVRFSCIIAPDDEHETPWRSTLALGLPKIGDPEKPTDRERVLLYFDGTPDARPVGPFVGVHVPTQFPAPYFALRAASNAVMAQYAFNISALRAGAKTLPQTVDALDDVPF